MRYFANFVVKFVSCLLCHVFWYFRVIFVFLTCFHYHYSIIVLLEDQGLPEEVLNKKIKNLGECPSRGICFSLDGAQTLHLAPYHWTMDSLTSGPCFGQFMGIQPPLEDAQFLAFPAQGNGGPLTLQVISVHLFHGDVVQGDDCSHLGLLVWSPVDSLEGRLATSQLLKTTEKLPLMMKSCMIISMNLTYFDNYKTDISNCVKMRCHPS